VERQILGLHPQTLWSPGFVGLDPIAQTEMSEREDLVCVPKEYFTAGRRLRRRTKTETEVMEKPGQIGIVVPAF
jgi:hypothetical protein